MACAWPSCGRSSGAACGRSLRWNSGGLQHDRMAQCFGHSHHGSRFIVPCFIGACGYKSHRSCQHRGALRRGTRAARCWFGISGTCGRVGEWRCVAPGADLRNSPDPRLRVNPEFEGSPHAPALGIAAPLFGPGPGRCERSAACEPRRAGGLGSGGSQSRFGGKIMSRKRWRNRGCGPAICRLKVG